MKYLNDFEGQLTSKRRQLAEAMYQALTNNRSLEPVALLQSDIQALEAVVAFGKAKQSNNPGGDHA